MGQFKISEKGRNGHPVYVTLERRDKNTVQVVAVDKCGHRHNSRPEERRVGKEWRSWGSPDH